MNPATIEITAAEIQQSRHRPWLEQGRSRPTIAVLTDNIERTRGGYEYTLRIGFQGRCRELGIDLAFVVGRLRATGTIPGSHNDIFKIVGAANADGLIVLAPGLQGNCGIDLEGALLPKLRGMPLCSVGLEIHEIPSIVHDGRAGMVQLVEHVVSHHARRRVLFVDGIPSNPDAIARLEACREVMSRHGLSLDSNAVVVGNFSPADSYSAIVAAYGHGAHYDAIITANDGMALSALNFLCERMIAAGEEVSVTGFDDMPEARFSQPPLTTVSQPLERMARVAIDVIAAQWLGQPTAALTTIEADLIVRESCGCQRRELQLPASTWSVGDREPTGLFAAELAYLAAAIAPLLGYTREASLAQAQRLLSAVELELTTESGTLSKVLGAMAEELLQRDIPGEGLVQAVRALKAVLPIEARNTLARLLPALDAIVMGTSVRYQLDQRRRVESMYASLVDVGHRMLTTFDRAALASAIVASLRLLQCDNAYVGIFGDMNTRTNTPLAYIVSNELVECLALTESRGAPLLPVEMSVRAHQHTIVVLPIANETKLIGVLVVVQNSEMLDYQLLRDHIETAMRLLALQDEVRRQATLAERSHQERLATAERLRSLGLLAGGVAHDLNNALGSLVALSEVVAQELTEIRGNPSRDTAQLVNDLAVIQAGALRAADTVKDLMVLGRREQLPRRVIGVERLVRAAIEDIKLQMTPDCIERIVVTMSEQNEALAIHVSESHVIRAIGNLLRNALGVSQAQDVVSIAVESRVVHHAEEQYETIPPGAYVVVSVSDKGPGIDPLQLPRIFEPFYTTKRSENLGACGLGLAIVHSVVKEYGGYLNVRSQIGVGSVFELYFPSSTSVQVHSSHPPIVADRRARLLVVDDDPTQLRTARRVLERLGYDVITLSSGRAAVKAVIEAQDSTEAVSPRPTKSPVDPISTFDVIVFDVALNEEKSGIEYLTEIRQSLPHQRAIITSGHGLLASEQASLEHRTVWLPKPYTANALGRAVQSLMTERRTDSSVHPP